MLSKDEDAAPKAKPVEERVEPTGGDAEGAVVGRDVVEGVGMRGQHQAQALQQDH